MFVPVDLMLDPILREGGWLRVARKIFVGVSCVGCAIHTSTHSGGYLTIKGGRGCE